MDLKAVFRWVIAAQVMAVLLQALMAGLALSGSQAALRAHMALGGATLLIAAVQAIAAFLLTRNARFRDGWSGPASRFWLLTLCKWQQVVQLFALHRSARMSAARI